MKHFLLLLAAALLLNAGAWAAPKQIGGTNTYWDTLRTSTTPLRYILTISGTGAMPDYPLGSSSDIPWSRWSDNISGLIIEDGVTAVGSYNFNSHKTLASVDLPENLISIGVFGFGGCSSLTSITLPASLDTIKGNAFSSCSNLTSILFPENLRRIELAAFAACTSLTSVNLPEGLKSLEQRTFNGCTGLISVTLPASLTAVSQLLFNNCTNLATVVCLNPTPPVITIPTVFDGVPDGCALEVPPGSATAYRSATTSPTYGWNWTGPISEKTPQSIIWSQTFGSKVCGSAPVELTASTTPGSRTITYASSDPSVATVSGNTLTIVGGGKATIEASQAGTGGYLAAQTKQQTLTVNKVNQTISWAQSPTIAAIYGDSAIALNATASSGGAVSYSSATPTVGRITDDNTLNPGVAGSSVITATQLNHSCYNSATATATLTVSAAQLTYSAATVTTREYNGKTSASITDVTLGGLKNGETMTRNTDYIAAGVFDDANVGTNRAVTVTFTNRNTVKSKNYTFPAVSNTIAKGSITSKALTIAAPTPIAKPYDGNCVAEVTLGKVSGNIDGKNLVVEVDSARFGDAGLGTGKTVTVVYKLSGSKAGNYTAPENSTVYSGSITAAQLTIAALTPIEKTYDGNNIATVTLGAVSGNADGENLVVEVDSAHFDNADVDTGKTVTVYYSLSGSAKGNYTAPENSVVSSGSITAASLTIDAPVPIAKIYDGNNIAEVILGEVSGNIDGSEVVVEVDSARFGDANVGLGKTVTVVYKLTGSKAGNYTAPENSVVSSGSITAAPLTIDAPTPIAKTYDGNRVAEVTLGEVSGNVDGKTLRVEIDSARFGDANVGSDKTVTVYYSLSGSAKGNYTAPENSVVSSGSITVAQLTIADPTPIAKTYDGNRVAEVTLGEVSGNIDGKTLRVEIDSARFDDADVGTSKTVTVVYKLNGSAKGNYTAPENSVVSSGSITAAPLTIAAPTPIAKTYDGNNIAEVTLGEVSGNIDGGNLVVEVDSARFGDADVGMGKTVTVVYKLSGSKAGNYTAPENSIVSSGSITAAPLTIAAPTPIAKTYDGNNIAEVTLGEVSGNVDGGEVVVEVDSARFGDADVGTGKTVTVVYKLSGSKAGNYTAPENSVVATGEIVPDTVTVTPHTGQSKVYGTADPDTFAYSAVPALIEGNTFSGNLLRVPGDSLGNYAILQGSLMAGDNYTLVFYPDTFEITPAELTFNSAVVVSRNYLPNDSTATVIEVIFNNLQYSDTLTLGVDYSITSAVFDGADADSNKNVVIALAPNPTATANNYTFPVGNLTSVGNILPANQTITWAAPDTIAATLGDTMVLTATATSGLKVSYSVDNETIAILHGDTLSIVGAGTVTISASQSGNRNYNPAPPVMRTLNVIAPIKQDQSIEWNQTLDYTIGDTVLLTAEASSGLAIRYTSDNESVAVIMGDTLIVTGSGMTIITATQPGNNYYNPAPDIEQTFITASDTAKRNQLILWNQTLAYTAGNLPVVLTAEATSLLPISYFSSNTDVALVIDNVLIIMGPGMADITATQPGNNEYNPAPVEPLILTVGDPDKQNQTILWEQTLNTTYNGSNPGAPNHITLTANTTGLLPVHYISSNTRVAVIAGSEVIVVGAGQATITAVQSGNDEYNPAPVVQQILTVSISAKAEQTILWEQTLEGSYNVAAEPATIALEATASSGLPIRYLSNNTKVATVSGNVLTIVGAGRAVITATQRGNRDYNPAPVVKRVLATATPGDAYPFDDCATTMYCNFFMLKLRTLRTMLNADNLAQGLDTVIILHARWYLNGEELTTGVAPAGEFIAGSSYSAGDSKTAYLAPGVYHFVLHLSRVYADGSAVEDSLHSGSRTVGECAGSSTKLLVYPNPVANSRSIFVRAALDASPGADNMVRIYSLSTGALVKEVKRLSELTEITLTVAPGTYSVQTNGEQVKVVIR